MNLNKVYLIGRLTQDPEMRSTASGQNVTTIRLATNRVWNDPSGGGKKEATEFHSIVAWGRLGEIANQYMKKGSMAMIEGRLQTRSWMDQATNAKRYMTEIVAENLQMGPRAASAGGGSYQGGATSSQYRGGSAATAAPEAGRAPAPAPLEDDIPIIDENEPVNQGIEEGEMKISEKDIPF